MGQRFSVLVVDADDTILSLFQDLLSPEYQVQTAPNCVEAADLLAERHFSLLIVELQMPIMDGASFIRILRSNREFDNLPLLVMTAYPPAALVLESVRPERILYKPFELNDLILAVAELTRHAARGPRT